MVEKIGGVFDLLVRAGRGVVGCTAGAYGPEQGTRLVQSTGHISRTGLARVEKLQISLGAVVGAGHRGLRHFLNQRGRRFLACGPRLTKTLAFSRWPA